MKQKSMIISCYALLILIGGIIGYVAAHSLISLVISSLFALLLFGCSLLIWQGHPTAYHLATTLVFCLFLFFTYRFLLTYKLAPGGIMLLISGGLFIYLFTQRKQISTLV